MKTCTKCLESKSRAAFFARKASLDGLQHLCKICDTAIRKVRKMADSERERQYQLAWRTRNSDRKKATDKRLYEENREERKAWGAQYYAKNKPHACARNKAWRLKNSEAITAANRRKREENGDHIRAKRRQHYAENKARYVAQARAREDRTKRATPLWADMEKIAAFYVERQRLSEMSGEVYHVDHIVPLRGRNVCGLHVHYNLQVIPKMTNLRKSNDLQEAA